MHKVFYELCHYSPDSASLSVAAICSGFLVVGVRTTGVLAFVFPEELIFPEGTTVGSSGSIVLSSNGVDTLMVVRARWSWRLWQCRDLRRPWVTTPGDKPDKAPYNKAKHIV